MLLVAFLLSAGLFAIAVYRQILLDPVIETNTMGNPRLLATFMGVFLLFLSIYFLFRSARLTTVIDETGISYRFSPFHFSFRHIKWESVEDWQVVTYNPVLEYGGWGVRFGKHGWAYNVSGDKGLQIHLKNGKCILIGTQRSNELKELLNDSKDILINSSHR